MREVRVQGTVEEQARGGDHQAKGAVECAVQEVVGMVVEANLIIILLTATRGWRLCLHGRPGHLCQQSHD